MKPSGAYSSLPSELFSILLDNTREILLLINRDLELVLFNKLAFQTAKELIKKDIRQGMTILDLADEDKRDWMRLLYEEVFTGREKIIRYPVRNLVFKVSMIPVSGIGVVDYVLISCENVTYEEEAVEHIRNKQFLLQQAERIAGLGSWEWDIPSGTVLWSDEFYRIMDFEPGETPATRELGFSSVHPEDVVRAEQTLQNTLDTGEPYETELRLITRKGRMKYMLCQGVVTRDKNGRLSKLIGTFLDITAKKQLEESIYNQNQRFKTLIEKSADLILQVNDERLITYCSPASEKMLGYLPSDLEGKRLKTLAWPEDLERLQQELVELISNSSEPKVTEYRCMKKDGTFLWVEATVSNHLGVPGINSIVINQRDIHHRKEAEELLKELNEQLQARAKELTLSNTELEKFAYIASHDLQEPLRMVSSFLGLLKKKYNESLDDKGRQYIDMAVDGSDRMKMLINDLLDYSRVGREREVPGLVDLNEIVEIVKETFSKKIQETGATIHAGMLPVIRARKIHMTQLLQNLVGNALKYRSDEPPVIRIGAAQENDTWIINVEDNGIGIPEKFSGEVFNIFQRLHGRSDFEGTGIGLAICKKIVEVYGGTISVSPAKQGGSIFSFTIPVQKETDA